MATNTIATNNTNDNVDTKQKVYDDCPICCEHRKITSWVKCPYCDFSCCRSCVKRYLLDDNSMNPKCMQPSCGKDWSLGFIAENTRQEFHNKKYRDHRANIMMQLEKSLLPGTQAMAERKLHRHKHDDDIKALEEENKLLRYRLHQNQRQIYEYRQLRENWRNPQLGATNDVKEKKKKVVRVVGHCPYDDCKGFIDTTYVCGLCNNHSCALCLKPKKGRKDPDHECDADDVETTKLLKDNTKACPGCSVLIFKSEGCSQMFCTNCQVVFDWDTMQIQNGGVIHNPHFYQYQRNQNGGIAPRDNRVARCGGVVNWFIVEDKLYDLRILPWQGSEVFEEAYRSISHIRLVVLGQYPNTIGIENNMDLRVEFLCNEITEKQWLTKLKTKEKKREKNRAIHLILSMYIDTLTDTFNNFVDCQDKKQAVEYINNIGQLREYANRELKKISERFKNKTPTILDDMSIRVPGQRIRK